MNIYNKYIISPSIKTIDIFKKIANVVFIPEKTGIILCKNVIEAMLIAPDIKRCTLFLPMRAKTLGKSFLPCIAIEAA
jgi:hypothetical protein